MTEKPYENGCRHFINVIGDVQKGVIDEPALVDKVKEVYDSLRLSEVPGRGSVEPVHESASPVRGISSLAWLDVKTVIWVADMHASTFY